MKSRVLCC